MSLTNKFSYAILLSKSERTDFKKSKKHRGCKVKKEVSIMDMFSFLSNGPLFCLFKSHKNKQAEEREYRD